jgi:Histidine phosphatase superfamily (branch 2)
LWPLAAVLLLSATMALDVEKTWYTKYPAYPPYCSTPEEMATRKIPDLNLGKGGNETIGPSTLLHVSVLLRHGARTPWSNSLNCWEDYWTNPATGIWDCNLTTWLAPPPPERVTEEGAEAGTDEAMFFFEKHYDALNIAASNLSNFLGGTCQKGQMLLQGYMQELQNGKFLRAAYIQFEDSHNPRMTLIDNRAGHKTDKHGIWNNLYYRVDDEARTLMSGQVVLRGLFGPELQSLYNKANQYAVIPLHTADYERDVMTPNQNICPRLAEIQHSVENSAEHEAKFVESDEAKTLKDFTEKVLKVSKVKAMDAIDCLMTTMCTDRPLPEAVNDYKPLGNGQQASHPEAGGEYGSYLFQRLVDFQTEKYNHILKANDAEYAKLGMAPLWNEILDKLEPHLKGDKTAPKIAVWSGHDTTMLPLLASISPKLLDDKAWPPYASMVALEIHEVKEDLDLFPSMYAFRLVYNGQSLTEKIDLCNPGMDLCDVAILLDLVKKFSNTSSIDCGLPPGGVVGFDLASFASIKPQDELDYALTEGKHIVATPQGVLALTFASLACFLLGFYCDRCRRRFLPSLRQSLGFDDGEVIATTDEYDTDLALESNIRYRDEPSEASGLNAQIS